MRIGVTNLFRGSAFGSASPQVALYLAHVLLGLGHEVEFIVAEDSDNWFIDCLDIAPLIPVTKLKNGAQVKRYHLIIEVVWFLPVAMRRQLCERSVMFYHYPPVFYDIESSTYPLTSSTRDFSELHAIWTWSTFKKTDYEYLEFISGCPVLIVPFLWSPVLLDSYCKEASVPAWVSGPKQIAICESNESNTSNCTLPITVLSEIVKVDPSVKWKIINGATLLDRPFFVSNILTNLHVKGDISGNFFKRVRLPDLRREPTVILAHQRWRPLKYMLLDALHLGIPLIHNCEALRSIPGGEHFYSVNRIGQALDCWKTIGPTDLEATRRALVENWGSAAASPKIANVLQKSMTCMRPVRTVQCGLRIAFFDMWADYQPSYNAFTGALTKAGVPFELNQIDPTVVIFGPFGTDNENIRYKHIPKIFYTGENAAPVIRSDVVLNIGFQRDVSGGAYIRLPNWMTELNWFDQNSKQMVNPEPFSLDLLKPQPIVGRQKFCAFVASNAGCVQRNSLFHMISRYKRIDSAGSVFPNMEKIPCGAGGAGGQHAKVEFYKDYKFALVCENSCSPGYVTEKILHAKLAGCVPIYWGDPLVALEFDSTAFINVSAFQSEEQLLKRIQELDTDESAWKLMASKPLLSEICVEKCKEIWTDVVKRIVDLKKPTGIAMQLPPYNTEIVGAVEGGKAIITCCNSKFVTSALRLIRSSVVPVFVWVFDVSDAEKKALELAGAKRVLKLDTTWSPGWPDFWNPTQYAWKPLVVYLATNVFEKGTSVLYLDSGIDIAYDLSSVWAHIKEHDMFVVHMPEHKMKTWSHPQFCKLMTVTAEELEVPQYSANILGFKVGGLYHGLFKEVFTNACKRDVITGQKWFGYSEVCMGHRHDQSLYTLLGHRANVKPLLFNDYVEHDSYELASKGKKPFYLHRGHWRKSVTGPALADGCFVVNLAHREDRLALFKKNHPDLAPLVKQHMAVYGRNLVLTKEIRHLFRKNDFKWKKSVMGCALSHYELWQRLAASTSDSLYLILEDDVKFEPGFLSTWNKIKSSMPADADVVFLGGVLPPNKPALPHVTEKVNEHFARVKKHNLFGGASRRFFHFCTYSYFLTKAGAEKLCSLIEREGIFTSMDHMLVNHGDGLLNIYFTYPLLAGCIQDADPVYQNADFNNFNRVDKFDSEIWNNLDAFSDDEIMSVGEELQIIYFEENQRVDCIESEWLAEIFARPLTWVDFRNPLVKGSRCLLYYQHTTPKSIVEGWINRNMDCQLYLLHMSDERCIADVSLYTHPGIKGVFRNYWRQDVVGPKVLHFPLGYYNGRGSSSVGVKKASERLITWSFAGAMDRPDRLAILDVLQKDAPSYKLHKTPTWKSELNLEAGPYTALLDEAQFIPCLNGFYNVESYRFYEALEHGAIPLVPLDPANSYANILSGSKEPVLLGLADMKTAGHVMTSLSDLDAIQEEIRVWWSDYKKECTTRIHALLFKA